jgi:hypothetical protein
MKDKTLDELIDAADRGLLEGEGREAQLLTLGFQYRVAKAQERWTWITISVSVTSVVVAIAAVVIAAIK